MLKSYKKEKGGKTLKIISIDVQLKDKAFWLQETSLRK